MGLFRKKSREQRIEELYRKQKELESRKRAATKEAFLREKEDRLRKEVREQKYGSYYRAAGTAAKYGKKAGGYIDRGLKNLGDRAAASQKAGVGFDLMGGMGSPAPKRRAPTRRKTKKKATKKKLKTRIVYRYRKAPKRRNDYDLMGGGIF